jgi:hypothetical protein
MGFIIAFPEDCILTKYRDPNNRMTSSLSEYGSDVRTLGHDEDVKTFEFSFLDNWSAKKQPTANWYKFNNNGRASEPLALQANADLSDLKNAGRYGVHNRKRSTSTHTNTAQHMMRTSMACNQKSISYTPSISYTLRTCQQFFCRMTIFFQNNDIFLLIET